MPDLCQTCNGTGEIVGCCDDLCHGLGECIHGDMVVCPECHGDDSDDGIGDDYDDGDDFDDDPLGRPGFLEFLGPTCRVCGCDDMHACVVRRVPCHWVEDDLCSACAGMNKGARRRRRRAENRARKARVRELHRRGQRSGGRY